MIIYQEQLNYLKSLLTDEEFDGLSVAIEDNDIDKFQSLLDDFIVMRFKNNEPTVDSDNLEAIYYEIYNQN